MSKTKPAAVKKKKKKKSVHSRLLTIIVKMGHDVKM